MNAPQKAEQAHIHAWEDPCTTACPASPVAWVEGNYCLTCRSYQCDHAHATYPPTSPTPGGTL